jgi:peptidoglycan/xylan/chitin deacetylase (PgdA/CDA1 family)
VSFTQPHLVLAYHAVSSTWPSSLAIPEKILAAQLAFLHRRDFTGLTFAEAERRIVAGTLPRRSVVITFDDGYHSTLRAKPILERFGFPATVFVVTTFVESGELMRWFGVEKWISSPHAAEMKPLRWADLEGLVDAGWEVGSHAHTHAYLPVAPEDVLQHELAWSREVIGSRLGRCETLAYPYGRTDARVAQAAESCGYLAACALGSVHWGAGPYRRARLELMAADRGTRLRVKLSPPAGFVHRSRLAHEVQRAWRGIHPRRDWLPSGGEAGRSKAEPGPPG